MGDGRISATNTEGVIVGWVNGIGTAQDDIESLLLSASGDQGLVLIGYWQHWCY
jgi:hypothetical protein